MSFCSITWILYSMVLSFLRGYRGGSPFRLCRRLWVCTQSLCSLHHRTGDFSPFSPPLAALFTPAAYPHFTHSQNPFYTCWAVSLPSVTVRCDGYGVISNRHNRHTPSYFQRNAPLFVSLE